MKIVFNLFFCYYLISFLRETLPLLFLCFFERLVFFSTAFELCILIILHENKTQRVNQRTDRTETDIDRMTDQQDQQHTNRTQDNIHPFCHIDGQRVEYPPQNRPGQTNCEQTNVRKRISQQARSHIISIPKSRTEVQEDVLSRRIVEKSHQQTGRRNT